MNLFGGVVPITGITFLMFSLFAILAIGYALGRITIKGVSLRSAGVFIIALVFGCLFYDKLDAQLSGFTTNALKIIENLGLVLFVASVGFIAGPKFFSNMKKNFTLCTAWISYYCSRCSCSGWMCIYRKAYGRN